MKENSLGSYTVSRHPTGGPHRVAGWTTLWGVLLCTLAVAGSTGAWTGPGNSLPMTGPGIGAEGLGAHALPAEPATHLGATITNFTTGGSPWAVAIDHTDDRLFISRAFTNNIVVAGELNNTPFTSVTTSSGQLGVAYDPANGDLFASTSLGVGVYAAGSGTSVGFIPLGSQPYDVIYDPNNGDVYTGDQTTNQVAIINATSLKVLVNVTVPTPARMTYDPVNGNVYVASYSSGVVAVISSSSNSIIANVTVGTHPADVTYDNSTGDLVATNSGSNTVSVIDPTNESVIANVNAGFSPWGLVYSAADGCVYVADSSGGTITVLNGTTFSSQSTLTTGGEPWGAAYDPTDRTVYVTDHSGGLVWVIDVATSYPVVFSESGLPSGTGWSVTLAGLTASTTSTTVTVRMFNGSWSYAIVDVPGWHQSTLPYTGTVTVSGVPVTEPAVLFVRVTYPVSFQESGLPVGGQWWVNLSSSASLGGTSSSLTVTLGNGTYTYQIASANKSYQALGGSFNVSAASLNLAVAFSLLTFSVSFSETGLPASTPWNLTFGGATQTSVTPSMSFPDPNGTYGFSVAPVPGYNVTPSAGNVSVRGHPTSGPTIQFSLVPLTIYAFTVTPQNLTVGGTTYLNVTAAGGQTPYSYVYSGLPAGCVSSDTPNLVCAPTVGGVFNVTVTVSDANSTQQATAPPMTVSYPSIVVTSFAAAPASVAVGGTTLLAASVSGGNGVYHFAYSGLPLGCASANASSLSCIPEVPGTYNLTVWVNDTVGQSAQGHALLTATGTPPSPLVVSLRSNRTSVTTGMPFSLIVSASGGIPPYSCVWQLNGTNDSLAPYTAYWNLSLSHPGNYTYRAWVSDGLGQLARTAQVNVSVTLPGSPGGGGRSTSSTNPLTATYLGVPLWAFLVVLLAVAILVAVVLLRRRQGPSAGTTTPAPSSAAEGARPQPELDDFVPSPPQGPHQPEWEEESDGPGTIVLRTPSGTRIAYDERTGAVLTEGRHGESKVNVEKRLGDERSEESPFGDEIKPEEVNPNVQKLDPQVLQPVEMSVTPEGGKRTEVPSEIAPSNAEKSDELVARAKQARAKRGKTAPKKENPP